MAVVAARWIVGLLSLAFCANNLFAEKPYRIGDVHRQPNVSVMVGSFLESEGATTIKQPQLRDPVAIDFDQKGNMIIVERVGGRVHQLARNGKLTRLAGDGSKSYDGDGELATRAKFNLMHDVLIGPDNNVYIADMGNSVIRKIERTSGRVSTFAGTGQIGFSGDGGRANLARFEQIVATCFSPEKDRMYLVDLVNVRVRMIDMHTDIVQTIAGTGEISVPFHRAIALKSDLVDPRSLAIDSDENLYLLEDKGHALRRITNGRIVTVAGTGESGYRDGLALESTFHSPKGICVDDQDRIFIADDRNNAIRMYDPDKERVTTILGKGQGKPVVTLKRPHGVRFYKGKLYVVDSGNNRILRLD